MALYFGSKGKIKINFVDGAYNMQLFYMTPIIDGIKLLSSSDLILKDTNGLFITAKNEE